MFVSELSRKLLRPSLNVVRRSTKPLDLQRLESGGPLWFALVNPKFEAPTAEMRAVLPKDVPMSSQIHNAAMGGSLVRFVIRACCTTCPEPEVKAPPAEMRAVRDALPRVLTL